LLRLYRYLERPEQRDAEGACVQGEDGDEREREVRDLRTNWLIV